MKSTKANSLSKDYVPVVVEYDDAEYDSEWDDTPVRMSESGACVKMGGTYLIERTANPGATYLLDVAMYYSKMPDFCGGYVVHSPRVEILTPDNFDEPRTSRMNCRDLEGMLKLPEARSDKEWMRLGYRALAKCLVRAMTACTTYSAMMAGQTYSGAPTQQFFEAFDGVSQSAGCYCRMSETIRDRAVRPLWMEQGRTSRVYTVDTQVNHGEEWKNLNSGNTVQWTELSISNVEFVEDVGVLPEETLYADNAYKWLRRRTWRNG